ncbi:hypothetical protein SARC_09184 [Sphaeroforma arctica JP610]|uniref:Eukaryotic translation initiation factor 3 subunit M n=1 Tax=Sphaeroforma arctica JP610 TaxID=667725 RepID=A0A0L0FNJ7_9EUKA|nr:hypothetical protein SARC_09184 [Sphaeroforma arctica JP610]KNC78382.1 hypothetical protein SARC_09184 [Sphaeroforma arctica JP610]|eukprot:XP_014152284.1 hypothetical protein SARC_09184 [Sphaeroforma arctica JP610]
MAYGVEHELAMRMWKHVLPFRQINHTHVIARELAFHIDGLTQKTEVTTLCEKLETAEDFQALCAALIEKSPVLLNESDSAAEASIYAIVNLCSNVEPADVDRLLSRLVSVVEGGPADRATIRVKLLAFLFNNMNADSSARYTCYNSLVKVCGASGYLHALESQFEQLPEWLAEWNCDQSQTRTLYRNIFEACKKCDSPAQARKFQMKFLQSFDKESAAEAKDVACEYLADAIRDSQCYIFDEAVELEAVKALEGVSPIYGLLQVFFSGDYKAFAEFASSNPGVFEEFSLHKDVCEKKMKLLTLISLSTDTNEVEYKQVAESLQVEEDLVELWLIEAMRKELVTGKLDQLNEKVIVRRAVRRTFGRDNWEVLSERLEAWSTAMAECLETLRTVQTQKDAGGHKSDQQRYMRSL